MSNKVGLIFGITGQDGSYLAELLLSKKYYVYGVARRTSTSNDERISHIRDSSFEVLQGDVTDPHSVDRAVSLAYNKACQLCTSPCLEVYNLAAQSHVRVSFDEPAHTWDVTAKGALNILESIRKLASTAKYYQAGSSEMFGASRGTEKVLNGRVINQQGEATPFEPRSPYAIAKLAAHHLTKVYRYSYNIFACNGILFNHESERRCDAFVTRKISKHIASLHMNIVASSTTPWLDLPLHIRTQVLTTMPKLKLGNLTAYRDWGHAEDFVYAMWLMLQQPKPDDYVIATGETHSVKEFLVEAFNLGLGYYSDSLVEFDESLVRPSEVNYLCGDYSKAKRILGWEPKIKFKELVQRMVNSDVNLKRTQLGLASIKLSMGEE
jgi:GDPmannose 4,6-dehydratase